MTRKSQTELEKPAKVYEVEAVQTRVDQLANLLPDINNKLTTLLQNQITAKQFEERLAAMTSMYDEKLKEEITKVHLEYGPLKKNITWFVRAVTLEGIAIIGQMVMLFITIKS